MPTCKRVTFIIDHGGLEQNLGKVSLVFNKPTGVSFGSEVHIYSLNSPESQIISAPSLREECARKPSRYIEECGAPKILTEINRDKNKVLLQTAAESVCIQYEPKGRCQAWPHSSIPLPSVVPCLCIQVWNNSRPVRSLSCPFQETAFLFKNIWQNSTVSLIPAHMLDGGPVLLWNLSAPCRVGGQVWPCERTGGPCREILGFRQQLKNHSWRQHASGRWINEGAFKGIDLHLSPCVMVSLGEEDHQLGPFCFNDTARGRWSLLLVGLILLILLVGFHFCLCHGRIKVGRILVISPPDGDAESVCELGSSLISHGFSVCVDQWCRKEQGRLGPLPWLHSQLLDLHGQDGRVVMVLTQRTEEWTHQHTRTALDKEADTQQIRSLDLFSAMLSLILAHKQLGRTVDQFLLVSFDSALPSQKLLDLLDGVPLFQLPVQMQSFLARLTGS